MNFNEHLKKYLSDKEIDDLVSTFEGKEHKGLLLNENKMSKEVFETLFPNVRKHPIVPNGYLFEQDEYEFGKKIYHELGAYYIQDPSAMLVSYFLNPKPNQKILDLCAAPGGKSVQASLLLKNTGILYSNDLSKSRANILLSNVERMGLSNVIVSSLDWSKISDDFEEYFDGIILDAPCSGSGMFRKMDEMKSDWTYEKVLKNSAIQKGLILMCYKMLKPGGTLMYSTCSYSYEEDEEVIEFLQANSSAKLEYLPDFDGFTRSKKFIETIHLFPNKFVGEGHYIAKIIKPGTLSENRIENWQGTRIVTSLNNKKEIHTFSLPMTPHKTLEKLALRPGLFESIKSDNRITPSHHLSHAKKTYENIELSKEEIIKYLHGETIQKNSLSNGYYFVSYLGINLGVSHAINGTLKNLYPKGLRLNGKISDCF